MLLYFVPELRAAPTLDQVQGAGLGYAFDRKPAFRNTEAGPGGHGVLVARDSGSLLDCNEVDWRQVPAATGWVGLRKGATVKPDGLKRDRMLDGHRVELADSQKWLVPVARGFSEEDGDLRWFCAVPTRLTLDAEGKWSHGSVVEVYAPLWALAQKWIDCWTQAVETIEKKADGGLATTLEFSELVNGSIMALAANYYLGPVEADLLGLLTYEIARDILDALVDLPTWHDWAQKKTQAAG